MLPSTRPAEESACAGGQYNMNHRLTVFLPRLALAFAAMLVTQGAAFALEYPIGKPQIHAGVEFAAVYLQPIVMEPPGGAHAAFGRHVDKETGVGPWFAPFTLEYDFTYAGTGKKGGY